MELHSQPPTWLEIVSWTSLTVAVVVAVAIVADIVVGCRRQKMAIMEVVYPVTALYWGPVTAWFYRRYGRDPSKLREAGPARSHGPGAMARTDAPARHREASGEEGSEEPITWTQVATSDSHCGAGCTIGDIVGEWLVFAIGFTIAGKALYADMLFDFVFAWTLGVVFQYCTIVPMRGLGFRQGVWAAVKADTLSIVAFQVGLFAGMFFYQELLFAHPLPKTTASYWMFMQLAMVFGFFTAYPVNKLLLRVGWKERM